ncbi:MAG TPA: alpha-mannosidase [Ktedonobacterales bacterium]|jgi:alpha-mannosidase
MKFTAEMIKARLPDLLAAARRERMPLEPIRIARGPGRETAQRDYDDSGWEQITVGERWGSAGQTYWFRFPVRLPDAWVGQKVAVHIALGEHEHISGPEALAYFDGQAVQGIDLNHRDLLLGERLRPGQRHVLALEAFSPLTQGQQTLRAVELVRLDPEAEALYHDMRVLHGALLTMPDESVERARLLHALERAYTLLDLRHPQSDDYLRSVAAARKLLQQEAYAQGQPAESPRIVAVGHAHIDLAWLWPVAQTRRKGARTFSTVLKLMEQYPDYHFVASQPALYQMVQQDEPELYGRIKEQIASGRWEPTGATWVEMDCNLSGGEALVRQFLFGKRFFRQELGVDPRVLWLPDAFGYTAALPQIMKGCGVDYFMTTKLSWNEYNRLPYDTFRWQGLDGSEVLTHMVTAPLDLATDSWPGAKPYMATYNAKFVPYDVAGSWRVYRQKAINDELLYLFGFGDGGGGPTATMQETAARLANLPGFPRVRQSSAEEFFRQLERRVQNEPDLPTWVGDLYLEYHRGTFTSQGWIKRANRHAELLYRDAEFWAALAGLIEQQKRQDQQKQPSKLKTWQAALNQGWESILFNQFHDILPGSSIPQVYTDARADYKEIDAVGTRVREEALETLAQRISTQGQAFQGQTIIALNPAPFAREDPCEVVLPGTVALPSTPTPTLFDERGQPLLVQEIKHEAQAMKRDKTERHFLVGASAPPLGYRSLTLATPAPPARNVAPATQPATSGNGLRITREVLENRFFRLRLDERGQIASLYDKRANREVIAPGEVGNQLLAFEDRPLDFPAWDINIFYNDKPYPIGDVTSWQIVETGPLRGGIELGRRYGESTITQRVLLYAEIPRIDFPTQIDWHEQNTLLKAAFPVTVHSPRATYEVQWGNVEHPTHWNTSWDWARFENCAHKWVDLSEGDYGVSLLNDCKYGYDVKGHTLRLTLLKSATWPDPQADQGKHEFSYALLPHLGDWRTGETVRHAYLFNMPATARVISGQPQERAGAGAALPPTASFVATDRPGLVIETVKAAEDGDGIIVRLYDAHNTRGAATLTFARPLLSAEETNLLEESLGSAEFSGHELRLSVRPYGIQTLRVRFK